MLSILLFCALPFALAASTEDASTFAGATSTAIYPPVDASPFSAYSAYFPDAEEVGYAGPTPSMYALEISITSV